MEEPVAKLHDSEKSMILRHLAQGALKGQFCASKRFATGSEVKTEGLLLHAIPYLGHGRIFKVFTPDGLISLIGKEKRFATLSPFCIAEWIYKKSKSDLFLLLEHSILDPLLNLRESYAMLSAAGSMAEALLSSQLPSKPAPHLYLLLSSYYKNLPRFTSPDILDTSFRLKLLLHEGLLSLRDQCHVCDQPAISLHQGESVCRAHSLNDSFSPIEWDILRILTFARRFSDLLRIQWDSHMKGKIDTIFQEQIRHLH